jgi:hypothetical protein
MLRKFTAFVPRYRKFESISLQQRVRRTSVPQRRRGEQRPRPMPTRPSATAGPTWRRVADLGFRIVLDRECRRSDFPLESTPSNAAPVQTGVRAARGRLRIPLEVVEPASAPRISPGHWDDRRMFPKSEWSMFPKRMLHVPGSRRSLRFPGARSPHWNVNRASGPWNLSAP